MIWEAPIHAGRSISSWLSNEDTGFSPLFIEATEAVSFRRMNPPPFECSRRGRIIPFQDFSHMTGVCETVKACSHTCDYALWLDCRGIAQKIRQREQCDWMDCSWRSAYINCDLLVISDIPLKIDVDATTRADRREVEIIMEARQRRGKCITIVIGPNLDLTAIERHKALNKVIKEASEH